jgi:hypothetical protein
MIKWKGGNKFKEKSLLIEKQVYFGKSCDELIVYIGSSGFPVANRGGR